MNDAQSDAIKEARAAIGAAPSHITNPTAQEPANGPPTRRRKLNAVSFAQVDAARALIKPQSPPRCTGKVVFEHDDTPADAEAKLSSPPSERRKSGPLPANAPPSLRAARDQIRVARAAIAPLPPAPPPTPDDPAHDSQIGPQLGEEEMATVVKLVQDKYGPILNIEQAAEVSRLAKQTIRERVCKGMYASSVVRGRPLRFWAHRFVQEIMR